MSLKACAVSRVSASGWTVNTSLPLNVAVPTKSEISHDTEIVPQLFQLARFGEHFSVQASAGYSALIGPVDGGANTLEYNVIFGWNVEREERRRELAGADVEVGEGVGLERFVRQPADDLRLRIELAGALEDLVERQRHALHGRADHSEPHVPSPD